VLRPVEESLLEKVLPPVTKRTSMKAAESTSTATEPAFQDETGIIQDEIEVSKKELPFGMPGSPYASPKKHAEEDDEHTRTVSAAQLPYESWPKHNPNRARARAAEDAIPEPPAALQGATGPVWVSHDQNHDASAAEDAIPEPPPVLQDATGWAPGGGGPGGGVGHDPNQDASAAEHAIPDPPPALQHATGWAPGGGAPGGGVGHDPNQDASAAEDAIPEPPPVLQDATSPEPVWVGHDPNHDASAEEDAISASVQDGNDSEVPPPMKYIWVDHDPNHDAGAEEDAIAAQDAGYDARYTQGKVRGTTTLADAGRAKVPHGRGHPLVAAD